MLADEVGLRRHLSPHIVPDDAVYILTEHGATALCGAGADRVVPLLDGTRTKEGLAREAGVAADVVDRLLSGLRGAGLLCSPSRAAPDAGPAATASALAYWDSAGIDGDDAARRVAAARIGIRALPGVLAVAPALREALRESGVSVIEDSATHSAVDLVLVLCGDLCDPELRSHADELAVVPWMAVRAAGTRPSLGPIHVPGDGPCWHCLVAQIGANRPVDAHLRERGVVPIRPVVGLMPVPGIGVQVAAVEALKWVAGYRHPGQQQVWTLDSYDLVSARHAVRRLPQCHGCGDPTVVRRRAEMPVRLAPAPVRSRQSGHRPETAAEVLTRLEPLVSPVTGVVSDVWQDPRCTGGMYSFRAAPRATVTRGIADLRSSATGECGGKGVTALDARVSALCESIERWAGSFHGDEAVDSARYVDVRAHAVHPDECRLQDPRQVADRVAWNAAHGPFQHVTEAFDEAAEIPWTPVWSLTAGRRRLLPTGMLYFGGPGPASVAADSNGCAAGSTLTDAVLQGLLELVERDAVALWWYNRTPLPGVDLDSAEPWVRQMRLLHDGLGRELWALDLTADLDVPVYAALSRRTAGPCEQILLGFGAHLDPEIALRRAVAEVNQGLPALDGLESSAALAAGEPDLAAWLATASTADAWLVPGPMSPMLPPGAHRYQQRRDLADDLADLRSRVERGGMEVLVLDQSRPDVDLAVARVVVPGMRHMWARLAPGRLFEVPVRLGRLSRPTAYSDLNPIPIFL